MAFAIKDAADMGVFNKETGVPLFYTEAANSFELKIESEEVFAKAKGVDTIGFNSGKKVSGKAEFEVIQFPQLSIILASDVAEKNNYAVAKKLKAKLGADKKVILKGESPLEGSMMAMLLKDDGAELGEKVEVTVTKVGDDTEVVFPDTVKEGQFVILFYQNVAQKVKVIKVTSEGDTPNLRIEAIVSAKMQNGKKMALNLVINNARAKNNAELTFSTENPSKFPMEFDCFPDELGEIFELTFIEDDGTTDLEEKVKNLDPSIKLDNEAA
ncbi:hypothetical protein [Peptostreptococcus faecalis]|uniref:hypothetical protein n=1 Tax=Peptostreptococcus faecalis TaxID=2045015 RepID=UPI000C7A14AA|nr:hypothetical protein [Peptostreptococcus faecalis]